MEGKPGWMKQSAGKEPISLPHPPTMSGSGPLTSGVYKTTQVRKERFKKVGNCKSAPLRHPILTSTSENKSLSTTNLDNSSTSHLFERRDPLLKGLTHPESHQKCDDPILSYIKSARDSLGLTTEPAQGYSGASAHDSLRESLLVSSGPIASVKDLKLLSRRLSSLHSVHYEATNKYANEESVGGGFVYALRKENQKRCNVYDLYITQPDRAKAQGRFYTVSAFSVSEVDEKGSMESIPSLRWLWERDIFCRIGAMPYFKNFTIRRAFKAWRQLICSNKQSRHVKLLNTNLFSADVLLQKAILHVQALCESASSSAVSNYLDKHPRDTTSDILFIHLAESVTYSLNDFMSQQDEAMSRARQELKRLREKIVTVIVSVCQEIANKEQMHGLCEHDSSDDVPSHIQVLHWRVIQDRLKRFVKLCGNLVLQLLQRLVLKANATLLVLVKRSIKQAVSEVQVQDEEFRRMREQVVSNPFTQGILDRQDMSLDDDDNEEKEGISHLGLVTLQAKSFTSFLPSAELGVGSLSDLVEPQLPADSRLSLISNHDLPDISELFKRPDAPILPLWEVQLSLEEQHPRPDNQVCTAVTFQPTPEEFKSALSSLLSQYELALKGFDSLAADARVRPYVNSSKYDLLKVLEEEASQKREHSRADDSWIDCYSLLQGYAPYQQQVEQLNNCLTLTMMEVQRKYKLYNCYSKMVDLCKNVNIVSSLSQEVWTVPMFQRAFALYHDQVHAMEGMILSFRVGMVEVKARKFQQLCQTYPQCIINELDVQLPRIATTKCDLLSDEIKIATGKMVETPSDVHSYIGYLNNVDSVSAAIPLVEKRLLNVTNIYNVAQQFDVEVCLEEMALYKSLFPQLRHLKNVLMQAQATKSETVYQFSADLRALVVGVLKQTMDIKTDFESPALVKEGLEVSSEKPLEKLEECRIKLSALLCKAKDYVEYHHIFGTIPSSTRRFHTLDSSVQSWTPEEVYDEVVNVSQSLEARESLFHTQLDWKSKVKHWKCLPIASLKISDLQKEVNGFINRVDSLENDLSLSNKIVSSLQTEVTQFCSQLPTLSCLLNPALKIRHWDVIHKTTGGTTPLSGGHSLTIDYLEKMKVFEHQSIISSVSYEANHEAALENMLKKLSSHWLSRELVLVPHKGFVERPTYILAGVEDLLASLEDSLMTVNTLKSSRYVSPIKHSVLDWQRRLVLMMETVECWVHCQKNWLYLETIFAAVDIKRQLSSEAKLFLQADKSWRDVIRVVAEKATALKATTSPGVLEAFQACNVLLEHVFKSLEDFIETKRVGFGRLYFISNEELLDILAHIKEPLTVQSYLSKLFTNIKKLDVEVTSPVSAMIHGVVSSEDERIQLYKNVSARGSPEKWLNSLDMASRETVRRLFENGVSTYMYDARVQWCLEQPAQVPLAVALMVWTREVERCLSSESPVSELKQLNQTWISHIKDLTKACEKEGVTPLKQVVLSSLLTLDVHCRDVCQRLHVEGVTTIRDFEWIRHLRYYWDDVHHCCYLEQCCAQFPYGNEYLGCLSRLVVTPLTERCYLTLTTALHLNLGGLLLGPAGTGKSESVKDLAKAMGRFCLLINCSESLDHKVIGQLLSGLCQTGAWCCFDEFNRVSVEVLLVVAQQLKCIKEAKERRVTRFLFDGHEITLDINCGTFITLNPSYGGRVELPDNVRLLFRPVAMMVPDTAIIAEVLLLSSGFTTATRLAAKLNILYELMETQVSNQAHYDFGLRAVKAVISASKSHLQQMKSESELSVDDIEASSLVQAILEFNLSRLLPKDIVVMRMLLTDLFGAENDVAKGSCKEQTLLKGHLETAARNNCLQTDHLQLEKCCQLYSTLLVRHGVMVVGPTGTGKTTVIHLLKTALNLVDSIRGRQSGLLCSCNSSIGQSFAKTQRLMCELESINPKSVTIDELYGYVDKNTLEWKSGILPKILRKFCDQVTAGLLASEDQGDLSNQSELSSTSSLVIPDDQSTTTEANSGTTVLCATTVSNALWCPPSAPAGWKWIVLDGPVDPVWIENLNSVLDDSKLLCLSNSERIHLQPGVRLLFETDNLMNASPATVSRCGMVYMDAQLVCWKQYANSWLKNLSPNFPDECKGQLKALFDQSIEEGNLFLKAHKSELMCPLPSIGAVKTLCSLFEALLEYTIKEFPTFYQNDERVIPTNEAKDSSSSIGVQTLTGIYIPKKASKTSQNKDKESEKPYLGKIFELIGKLYVFSFTWAYGGCFECVDDEDDVADAVSTFRISRGGTTARSKFDALVHKLFSSTDDSVVNVDLPTSTDLIFSYYVNVHNCSFVQWKTLVPTPKQIATKVSLIRKGLNRIHATFSSPFFEDSGFRAEDITASSVPLIPTVTTVQLTYLASLLSKSSTNNLMFVGKVGVGKTQLIQYLFQVLLSRDRCSQVLSCTSKAGTKKGFSFSREPDSFVIDHNDDQDDSGFLYHLSRQTTSVKMQSIFENHLARTSLSVLKPSMGEKVVAFLDDLNMSATDKYGSQACSELLRQLLDNEGWHDRKNLIRKEVHGVQIVATCGRRGWGYTNLNERCLSKFSLFSVPKPSAEDLHSVFSAHVTTAFSVSKFTQEVNKSITTLISCAIFVLQEVRSQLKPSPSTPQYTFCTRDLSKVFSRMLGVSHRALKTSEDVMQLLSHELLRVFKDRCHPDDRDHILHIISEGLRINFKVVKSVQQLKEQHNLYEDFTSSLGGYSVLKNPKTLTKYLERTQKLYNTAKDKNFQMSFFPQVSEHILRLTRVLQQPRGHTLLIGVAGVGKRSCAKLSTYISKSNYHCLVPESTSNIQDEIKHVVIQCGVSQQSTCLVATENLGSTQADVLCTLHELLIGGELSSLFGCDEVESILNQMAEVVSVEAVSGYQLSSEELWKCFVDRVLRNLHIIFCLAPTSPLLTELQHNYQGVFTHSTINFIDEWNSKALYGIAVKEILTSEVSKSGLPLKDHINQLATLSVKMHGKVLSVMSNPHTQSSLSFSVTPASFIKFIKTFCSMLLERCNNSTMERSHLEAGLKQLKQTDRKVEQMKTELSVLQPEVESKAEAVESLLHELSTEQREVDLLRVTVVEEQAVIATETEQVAILKKEAESDLRTVLPALREAEKGLRSLKKPDLQEIRSYGSPPQMVVHVMSAVCLLLQQPTDWSTAKHLMADPGTFLRNLSTYDKDNIPDKVLSKLKKYTTDPNFNPGNVAHYSVACQSFCQWVLAIENYGRMYRIVEPKRKIYIEFGEKLDIVKSTLKKKEEQLRLLKVRMSELEEQHGIRVHERDNLQCKCTEISMKLRRAEDVTRSLKDEQVRWSETISLLDSQSATMIADTLLSAACMMYFGPFRALPRQALLNKWKQMCHENKTPLNGSFRMDEHLGDLPQILHWYLCGLPKDPHSVQNALITTLCTTSPLILDPQGQANRFLKNLLQSSGLRVLSVTSTDLLRDIKEAVITGIPVLIEDVQEQLNPQLEPFLVKQLEVKDGQMLLRVGKTEIEYNPSFRLFLVCPKANVMLSSEVCNKTTVVNFASTSVGLQDQLLSLLIKLKEPVLDSTHSELMLAISNDNRELKQLERNVLDILSTNEGSVLDDEELIHALKQVKQVATEVKGRLEKAHHTANEIMSSREKYLPVALRGSILYDEVQSLQSLSPMYQFSMEWFQQIFTSCIASIQSEPESSASKDGFQTYLCSLIDKITFTTLEQTSIALLSEHYIPFVFKVCCSICKTVDEISKRKTQILPDEWKVMIKIVSMLTSANDGRKRDSDTPGGKISERHRRTSRVQKPAILGQDTWDCVSYLEKHLACFSGLQHHIIENQDQWGLYLTCANPLDFCFEVNKTCTAETDDPQHTLNSKSEAGRLFKPSSLTSFQKLTLIQVLCPSHFRSAARAFVASELGSQYCDKYPLSLSELLKHTSHKVPILFILSEDKDPYHLLQDHVQKELGEVGYLDSISFGKGQEGQVMDLLHLAATRGKWVLLENCHLAASCMATLESYLKSLQTDCQVHPKFRLYLSCKPTPILPSLLLSSCVKVYLDSPKSIRSSMQQLISTESSGGLTEEMFEGGNNTPVYWKQLVYRLCLFHSAIIARKGFGAIGWTVPYEFKIADLLASISLLLETLSRCEIGISSWSMVHHLVGEVCYGGRITNPHDRTCLKGLLKFYFNKDSFHDVLQENKKTGFKIMDVVPPSMSYCEICARVDNLSVVDESRLIGLNQEMKSVSRAEEMRLFQLSLQAMECNNTIQSSSIQTKYNDDLVLERASDIQEKLSAIEKSMDKEVDNHSVEDLHISPLLVMLSRELSQWRDRVCSILESLQVMINAVKGEEALCGEMERTYQNLLCNVLPRAWTFGEDVELSVSLAQWLKYLNKSVHYILKLITDVTRAIHGNPLPRKFYLPAFTSPQGFFTTLKQLFSKKTGIPLEEINLKTVLDSDSETTSQSATSLTSFTISGISIEGASFNNRDGLVMTTGMTGVSRLPDLVCCAVRINCDDDLEDSFVKTHTSTLLNVYHCPVYTSSSRCRYVTSIGVPTIEQPVECNLKGVALVLDKLYIL